MRRLPSVLCSLVATRSGLLLHARTSCLSSHLRSAQSAKHFCSDMLMQVIGSLNIAGRPQSPALGAAAAHGLPLMAPGAPLLAAFPALEQSEGTQTCVSLHDSARHCHYCACRSCIAHHARYASIDNECGSFNEMQSCGCDRAARRPLTAGWRSLLQGRRQLVLPVPPSAGQQHPASSVACSACCGGVHRCTWGRPTMCQCVDTNKCTLNPCNFMIGGWTMEEHLPCRHRLQLTQLPISMQRKLCRRCCSNPCYCSASAIQSSLRSGLQRPCSCCQRCCRQRMKASLQWRAAQHCGPLLRAACAILILISEHLAPQSEDRSCAVLQSSAPAGLCGAWQSSCTPKLLDADRPSVTLHLQAGEAAGSPTRGVDA
jgi:hypothetical protein